MNEDYVILCSSEHFFSTKEGRVTYNWQETERFTSYKEAALEASYIKCPTEVITISQAKEITNNYLVTTVDGYKVNLEKTSEGNNVKLETNWSKLNEQ